LSPFLARRPRRAVVAATAAAALAALSLNGATATAATAGSVVIPGSVPSWAVAANDAGPAAAAATVEGEIYLPLRGEAAAQALATAVSTPGDAQYGKTLSPAQWIREFSPTTSDLKAVTDFVKSQGLTVTAVPASRQYVVFRGPAPTVSAAFGTTLRSYNFAGTQLLAPSSAPKMPAAVAAKVAGVSIDQGRSLTRPTSVKQGDGVDAAAPAARSAAPAPAPVPCSTYYGQHTDTVPPAYGKTVFPTNICGYIPGQLRSAYGVNKLINAGNDGSGQTVAIVDAYASPSIVSDTNTYALQTGSAILGSKTYQQVVPKVSDFSDTTACGGTAGWQSEQTLDVQSAHGIAPGAKLLYVGGFNCGGGLDIALSKVLDNKLATIVSNSYGNTGEAVPDSTLFGEQNQHIQAAAEGIGLYFSSGDNGDEEAKLGFTSPDFPASSPFVTSVGGTSLKVGAAGNYLGETGWGSAADKVVGPGYASPLPGDFAGGAGGGVSTNFAQPAYQKGVVPDGLATSNGSATPARVSPDVAALADPYTGFLIGFSPITDDATQTTGPYATVTYGGTSLASPLTAAQVALVQQATGKTVGFANPALYAGYKTNPTITRDITPSNPTQAVVYTSKRSGSKFLISLDQDSSLTTATGYDQVTGLGSINTPALVTALHSK
jgi:subtilase family serine protease